MLQAWAGRELEGRLWELWIKREHEQNVLPCLQAATAGHCQVPPKHRLRDQLRLRNEVCLGTGC